VDAALLLIRIAAALAFLFHGSGILFGLFGGPGPVRFAALMHMPTIVGYLVGLAQVGEPCARLAAELIKRVRNRRRDFMTSPPFSRLRANPIRAMGYSYRRASMGSMSVARRAGM
jgi:hypothetical protein